MPQNNQPKKKSLVKKVTFKNVIGKPETEIKTVHNIDTGKDEQKAIVIRRDYMRVAGVVDGTKMVTTDFGEAVRFLGNFRAFNLVSGEQFDGGELFLPEIAEVYLNNFIKGLGSDFQSLEFAFDIGVKPANSTVGYEFTVSPLIEKDDAQDPLAALFARLPQNQQLLLKNEKTDEYSEKVEENKPEKPVKGMTK